MNRLGITQKVTFDAPETAKHDDGTIQGYEWRCPFSHIKYIEKLTAKLISKCYECQAAVDEVAEPENWDYKTMTNRKR